MAKYVGYKRPKDTKKTLKHLFAYLGMHKWAFLSVAVLVFISAGANIMGTYLIKPVVNKFITPGDMHGLLKLWQEWVSCIFVVQWRRFL